MSSPSSSTAEMLEGTANYTNFSDSTGFGNCSAAVDEADCPANVNASRGGGGGGGASAADPSKSFRYAVVVPVLVGLCVLTFFMNAAVAAAFPFIRHLSKVGTVCKYLVKSKLYSNFYTVQ